MQNFKVVEIKLFEELGEKQVVGYTQRSGQVTLSQDSTKALVSMIRNAKRLINVNRLSNVPTEPSFMDLPWKQALRRSLEENKCQEDLGCQAKTSAFS